MSARALLHALESRGCSVRTMGSDLFVRPREVAEQFGESIRRYKRDLVQLSQAPACSFCGTERAERDSDRCPWCAVTIGQEVEYRPGSRMESDFLTALEAARKAKEV